MTLERENIPIEKIDAIIQGKLVPALDGEDVEVGVVSLLVMTLLLVRPDLNMDELQEHLLGLSGYLATVINEEQTENKPVN